MMHLRYCPQFSVGLYCTYGRICTVVLYGIVINCHVRIGQSGERGARPLRRPIQIADQHPGEAQEIGVEDGDADEAVGLATS